MLGQAAGLAVLASISPTALLVCAVLLGSAHPRRTVVIYLIGAVVATAVSTLVIFALLRAGHLERPQQQQARDGLRLGLGILMLIAGIVVLYLMRRRASGIVAERQSGQEGQLRGFVGRMLARPGTNTVFLIGTFLYAPSLPLVAAVDVVATAQLGAVAILAVLALVIAITVVAIWLPLLCFLIWPGGTGRALARSNAWLRRNGSLLVATALGIGGLYMAISGASGLA